MTKVMIATPAYDCKVNVPYALSYANTVMLLSQQGIQVQPHINASGSLLCAERNRIVQAFWESDCTHLLCIDADLGWPAQAVPAMLATGKEFVVGCYPARGEKSTFIFRPYPNPDGTIIQDKHLLRMMYVPAGFMLIARSTIAKMRDKHPQLYYEPKDPRNNPEPGYAFFNTEVWKGEFWGEDFIFCRYAAEAGVEIWADPLIQFDHAGTIGMLAECLKPIKELPPEQQKQNIMDAQMTLSEAA
jgi:hypothetical protein